MVSRYPGRIHGTIQCLPIYMKTHRNQPNVGKDSIHGWYGIYRCKTFFALLGMYTNLTPRSPFGGFVGRGAGGGSLKKILGSC